MTIVIALGAAAMWGIGDFCGGLAARRSDLLAVLFVAHGFGLVGLAVVALLVGGSASLPDLVAGALGGLAGGAGVAMLYRGLAIGVMAIVAPLTAVVAATVPVVAGVILGERLSPANWGGVIVAIAAVALLSGGRVHGVRVSGTALALAIGSGLAFAGFYIALSRAGAQAGLWPLVAARCASVLAFGLAIGASRRVPRANGGGLILILGCGLFDVVANILYVVAVHRGLLSIVAVLVSLYPASTVVCALIVVGERLRPAQAAGVLAALAAVTLIALG